MARVCVIVYTEYAADTRVRRAAEAFVARGDDVTVSYAAVALSLAGHTELSGVKFSPISRSNTRAPTMPVRTFCCTSGSCSPLAIARCVFSSDGALRRRPRPYHAGLPRLQCNRSELGAKVILDVHDLMPELYASKFDLPESHSIVRAPEMGERLSVRLRPRRRRGTPAAPRCAGRSRQSGRQIHDRHEPADPACSAAVTFCLRHPSSRSSTTAWSDAQWA